jgi:hypothetical protein
MSEESFDETISRARARKIDNSDAALIARAKQRWRGRACVVSMTLDEPFNGPTPDGAKRDAVTYFVNVRLWAEQGTLHGEIISRPAHVPAAFGFSAA